jgi:thymidine phosphorylase
LNNISYRLQLKLIINIIYIRKTNKVKKGDILAFIYANNETKGNQAVEDLQGVYEIIKSEVKKEKNILGVV